METEGTTPGTPGENIAAGRPPRGVRAAVATMMRRGGVPGLSLAVVNRDRVLLAAGYGLADRAANTPATASTSYLWFSMSKIVTATAALRLFDEGRLDLNAPAGEYVDYLRVPGTTTPSVGQLLNHTAGLGNPLPIRWVHPADADPPDPEALLRRLMGRRRAYRYPAGQSAQVLERRLPCRRTGHRRRVRVAFRGLCPPVRPAACGHGTHRVPLPGRRGQGDRLRQGAPDSGPRAARPAARRDRRIPSRDRTCH